MPDFDSSIHIDLDGAWDAAAVGMRTLDFRDVGPRVRYLASNYGIEMFHEQLPRRMAPFVLYGSGDFHHLAGLWLRRAMAASIASAVTVISFDNHPDWDRRPPRWGCGAWINRAIELEGVRQAQVWGCGNFELAWPHRLFANGHALREGQLVVHAWRERQSAEVQNHFDCMSRQDWRDEFEAFAESLANANVYITVDLDCLSREEAVTNWENGLFTAADIAWAIGRLRDKAKIIGGDMCGAWSPIVCRGAFRQFAAWWDHPKVEKVSLNEARRVNLAAFKTIWPALAGEPSRAHNILP